MPTENTVFFIVDDEPLFAKMAKEFILSKFPLSTILTYSTGEECLNELKKQPSVIILDYKLNTVNPNALNGLEVLKIIKKLKPKIPVIFISGQDNPEVSANTIKYGAYTYIFKNEMAMQKLEIVMINALRKYTLEKKLSSQKLINTLLIFLFALLFAGFLFSKVV